jgi:four helix bundle protein
MEIRHYKELIAWQKGHELVLEIYRASAHFPTSELYGLTSQIRRASVSITSNIAEGFSRNSQKEKIQFYHISKGSLSEIDNQITIAKDLGYIKKVEYDSLVIKIEEVGRIIHGLIKSIKI